MIGCDESDGLKTYRAFEALRVPVLVEHPDSGGALLALLRRYGKVARAASRSKFPGKT